MTDGDQVCNDAAAGIAGAHSRAALCVARVKAVFKTWREVVSEAYAIYLHRVFNMGTLRAQTCLIPYN